MMESLEVRQDSTVIGTIELREIRYPFEGYNIGEARLHLNTGGRISEIRKTKAVIRSNEGIELVSIVGKNFAIVPNQLVLDILAEVSKDMNLQTLNMRYDKHGNAIVVNLLSDKKEAIEVNDIVQFGVSIRNSIDGSSSLAVDAFSYRLACRNGAIARDSNLSFAVKHIGDPYRLIEVFRIALKQALQNVERLVELYRKMTRVKLTRSIAERLVSLNLPYMYYTYTPIRVEHDMDGKIKNVIVTDPESSVWEVFNAMTYTLTHKSRAGALSKSYISHRLHRAIERAL